MASRFTLPHIDISAFADPQSYSGYPSNSSSAVRVRAEHGRRIQNELNVALAAAAAIRPTDPRLDAPSSSILEVDLRKGTPADKLDGKTEGIRAGAAKENAADGKTIALYVPDHARPVLEKIIEDYLNGPLTPRGKNPPNKGKVDAIESIRAAHIATLWTDARPIPEDATAQAWWALWCYRDREDTIEKVCQRLEVRAAARDKRLYFHEVVVVPVLATRATIELMMFATDAIAELRLANDSPTFFTDDVRGDAQEWVDGLAERIQWPGNEVPAVCVLDTGINRGHSLIEPALGENDMHALNKEWGLDDHHVHGHGTSMAGLALHGDLTAALADTEERKLAHRLESVKILPPGAFDENEPRSYGVLTQAGLVLPEIEASNRSRVYCMAVTNDSVSGATASSWSAAIDQAAAGCMVGDEADDGERPRRLIFISAGNVPAETGYAFRKSQDDFPIEDPAQAWNALSVSGYTDLIAVRDEGYEDWKPLAEAGDLSPHSRTSVTWEQGIAPFKPELVLEAGNRAVSPGQTEILTVGSLSLLTTGHEAGTPLVPFEATSAATAQAARMAARLMAEHPGFWPETIRALMIHSAEWTAPMLAAIDATAAKRERYALIRRFGYGVPDFERANASAMNHLAMLAQAEIQPFQLQGSRKFNECHYYHLPIPGNLLEELENEPVELKVTLSYFIDPNPGLSANVDSQRYQSHGLRFDLQRPRETLAQFKKRVNASESESRRRAPGMPADGRWVLGADSISAGSLHCDVWRGPAIELLGRNMLCVKPINGWWRNRASPDVCNQKTRYSLIISLKTKNVELDIHTPISVAAAKVPIEVAT
jgi:hypothetical protein